MLIKVCRDLALDSRFIIEIFWEQCEFGALRNCVIYSGNPDNAEEQYRIYVQEEQTAINK